MTLIRSCYVMCDVCDSPASTPKADHNAAREAVPRRWRRIQAKSGRKLDVCSNCVNDAKVVSECLDRM